MFFQQPIIKCAITRSILSLPFIAGQTALGLGVKGLSTIDWQRRPSQIDDLSRKLEYFIKVHSFFFCQVPLLVLMAKTSVMFDGSAVFFCIIFEQSIVWASSAYDVFTMAVLQVGVGPKT